MYVKKLLGSGKRPMEIAEEHDEHFSSVIRFERRFSKYAEYKSPRNVKITAQPQMCMCASDHPALEKLNGLMTLLEPLVTQLRPTTPDGGTMAAISLFTLPELLVQAYMFR